MKRGIPEALLLIFLLFISAGMIHAEQKTDKSKSSGSAQNQAGSQQDTGSGIGSTVSSTGGPPQDTPGSPTADSAVSGAASAGSENNQASQSDNSESQAGNSQSDDTGGSQTSQISSGSGATEETINEILSQGGGLLKIITIIPKTPKPFEILKRGILPLTIQVYYGGSKSSDAQVTAESTLFGSINIPLINSQEGIYSANININRNVEKGRYGITYKVKAKGQYNELGVLIDVNPDLEIHMSLNDTYLQGQDMEIYGTVYDFSKTAQKSIDMEISAYHDGYIFIKNLTTNDEGLFYFKFPVGFADPVGEWSVKVTAEDESGNFGIRNLNPIIKAPAGTIYYSVSFASPLKGNSYSRGDNIPITVQAMDSSGFLTGAAVSIKAIDGSELMLSEIEPGIYSTSYRIDFDDPLGTVRISAEAEKDAGGAIRAGGFSIPIEITPSNLAIEILEPSRSDFYASDKIRFIVKLRYSNGEAVKGAYVNAALSNSIQLNLTEELGGIYTGFYILPEDYIGSISFAVSAEDIFGNSGKSETKTIYLSKRNDIELLFLRFYRDYFLTYWWGITLAMISLAVIFISFHKSSSIKKKLKRINEKEKNIRNLQVETEKKYYEEGSLSKNEFKELIVSYQEMLSKNKELKAYLKKRLRKRG